MGPTNAYGRDFLSKLGRKLSTQSDDDRDELFVSAATLRFYSAFQRHSTTRQFCEEYGPFRLAFCA